MKSRMFSINSVIVALCTAALCIPVLGWAQDATLTEVVANSAAEFDSPNNGKPPKFFKVRLQYLDADKKLQVTDVPVTVKAWDKKERQEKAQARKAQAIADAIQKAKLNGVSASTETKGPDPKNPKLTIRYTVPLCDFKAKVCYWKYRDGKPIYGPRVVVKGVVIDPANPKTKPVLFVDDITGELTGGTPEKTFKIPENTVPMPSTGSMSGKRSGLSSGTDSSGANSVFAFGFHSDIDGSDYVARLTGAENLTDSQILSELAYRFNSLCGQCGYTAYYDADTDELTFEQPLAPGLVFVTMDTDTELLFDVGLAPALENAY